MMRNIDNQSNLLDYLTGNLLSYLFKKNFKSKREREKIREIDQLISNFAVKETMYFHLKNFGGNLDMCKENH